MGFQTRNDTYTKKLAYVIYYDEKGKLRKEPSWNSWRDKKIDPEEFDNVPTEGFVLNKKVGGYAGDWGNFRQAYAENNRNRGLCVTNKSGVIGVHFDKKRNKWAASITLNGKKIFIGRFENKEAAIQARLQKEHELFGEFAPQQMLIYSLLNFKALVPK